MTRERYSLGGSWGEGGGRSSSRLIKVVGRTQFLAVVGQRSSYLHCQPGSLSALRGHPQVIKNKVFSQDCR